MIAFIIRRLLLMIPTTIGVALVVFLIFHAAPGDPATVMMGGGGTGELSDSSDVEARIDRFRRKHGLDRSLPVQFLNYVGPFNLGRDGVTWFSSPYGERKVREEELMEGGEKVKLGDPIFIDYLPKTSAFDQGELEEARAVLLDDEAGEGAWGVATRKILDKGEEGLPALFQSLFEVQDQTNVVGGRVDRLQAALQQAGASEPHPDATSEQRIEQAFAWYYDDAGGDRVQNTGVRKFGGLLTFSFGKEMQGDRPVGPELWKRIQVSLPLSLISVLLAYLLAIPLGIFSVRNQGKRRDGAITIFLFLLFAIPTFWAGLMLAQAFGVTGMNWLPVLGLRDKDYESMTWFGRQWDLIKHSILPIITLTYGSLAYLSRQMRAGMMEVIRQDYIRTARAKGLSEDVVIYKHALRNSMIPVITLLASILPVLIGGSIIVERVFEIPGMGRYAFDGLVKRDFNILMATTILVGIMTQLGILLSDLTYSLVDPASAMSKPSFESMEGLEQLEDAPVYSKDYWDLVIEQLGKRKLFKIGMAVLALLYGLAIYAPFLANDRPFRFEGVDVQAYSGAVRQLASIPSVMTGLMKSTDEEFIANLKKSGTFGQPDKTPQTRSEQFEQELQTLTDRVAVVMGYMPPDAKQEREGLAAMRNKVVEGGEAFAAGDQEKALALISEAKKSARAFRKELKALDPENPEKGGMDLVAVAERPLWDDLPAIDVFFMVLWAFVLLWPLWNPLVNRMLGRNRDKIRNWRMRKWLIVLAVSVLAAVIWRVQWGPGGDINQNSGYKHELQEGSRIAIKAGTRISESDNEFVVPWTPIRYGIAETHSEEQFRPPTWIKSSATDAEGRYVPKGSMDKDNVATSGEFQATFNKVAVRPGEPSRNAWNRHLAGVDELGRDFFSRMIWGSRTSLTVGILSAALLTIIGIFFGALAGYFGGWVDVVIMRLIEILQSIPAFYLILMTVAFIPADVIKPIFAIVIVIALIRWTGTARLVRGEFMRLREQEFVVASKALGFSNARTIFRHVLPNAMSPVLVSAAFAVAAGILTESAISFLGFGIKPPEASWGSLVNESKNPTNWWIQVFPGILIFITVTCYNLVGDAIRDAMDPKMKE